jgi:PleD family two-component response regulator
MTTRKKANSSDPKSEIHPVRVGQTAGAFPIVGIGASVKSAPVRLDGLRALIVDDEANAREAFSEVLSSFGAEIRAAGSAKEGFQIFEQFRPHVLISDIAMPVEDGYSLIQKIRTLSPAKGGDTPAIAMANLTPGMPLQ